MFATVVKSIKAFVLVYVASELLVSAGTAIYNQISTRNAEKAWNDHVESLPTQTYDPIATTTSD
jgi:hypothetical protein